jgi:hypothetical protein
VMAGAAAKMVCFRQIARAPLRSANGAKRTLAGSLPEFRCWQMMLKNSGGLEGWPGLEP